jgi:hypothetical protein
MKKPGRVSPTPGCVMPRKLSMVYFLSRATDSQSSGHAHRCRNRRRVWSGLVWGCVVSTFSTAQPPRPWPARRSSRSGLVRIINTESLATALHCAALLKDWEQPKTAPGTSMQRESRHPVSGSTPLTEVQTNVARVPRRRKEAIQCHGPVANGAVSHEARARSLVCLGDCNILPPVCVPMSAAGRC